MINAVLNSFPVSRIYFSRVFINLKTGRFIPAFNIYVKDPETAPILYRIKNNRKDLKMIEYITGSLCESGLEEFLAGVIDGDGAPDYDNIRVSLDKGDPLYNLLKYIFKI